MKAECVHRVVLPSVRMHLSFQGGNVCIAQPNSRGTLSCTALHPLCPSAAKGTENDGFARQCCLDKAGDCARRSPRANETTLCHVPSGPPVLQGVPHVKEEAFGTAGHTMGGVLAPKRNTFWHQNWHNAAGNKLKTRVQKTMVSPGNNGGGGGGSNEKGTHPLFG